jgi:hypothetical protein
MVCGRAGRAGPLGKVLDLSGAAYQGLGSLTLRFYGLSAEASTGTGGRQGPLSFVGAVVEKGAGGSGPLGAGDTLTLANATAAGGTQRAAARAMRGWGSPRGWLVAPRRPSWAARRARRRV